MVGVLPAGALSSTDQQLLGTGRREILPAATDTLLTWSQSTIRHPHSYNAYVRKLQGGPITKLNADGTRAYAGGIDGTEVVFQQVSHQRSDVKVYDTSSRRVVATPPGVNTKWWEWAPSVSGSILFFGRERYHRERYTERLILHDTTTGRETVLDSTSGRYGNPGPHLLPGQVNGDYVSWSRCDVKFSCDVQMRRISTGHTIHVPDRQQEYASSVAPDGTLFFVRSGRHCGDRARLMRYQNGSATLVANLAQNRDTFVTYAISPTQLVRDVHNCHTGDSNVDLTTIS